MKLDELADGSLYVDTKVLYMYLWADPVHLPTLTTFFSWVVRGAIEAFVGIPVLDELFYRLLLARVRDIYRPSSSRGLARRPGRSYCSPQRCHRDGSA
jgi:hypothetical protein